MLGLEPLRKAPLTPFARAGVVADAKRITPISTPDVVRRMRSLL
jgi:hypothetical protein